MQEEFDCMMKFVQLGRIMLLDDSEMDDVKQKIRTFLHDLSRQKEIIDMKRFYTLNGFSAEDDDAKRALIDELYYAHTNEHLHTDEERNMWAEGNEMMRIGWRRQYS
jgi:hypothetical protein